MALTTGSKATASDIKALKARVKAEMQRRKYTGSLTGYAGTSYDYSTVPAAGGKLLIEHYNKIVTPMRQVNATTTAANTVSAGAKITQLNSLSSVLSSYEGKSLTASPSDCASSCSGLCYTECGNTCKGCTGTCSGGCTSCSGCSGGCTSCSSCSGCSGGCEGCGHCDGGCWGCSSCSGCSGGCKGSCTATCRPSCYAGYG